jgi:hypothetical protein
MGLPPANTNGGLSSSKSARAPANLRRGFFRLWFVLSLCWVVGAGWFLRDQLAFNGPWGVPWRLIAPQFVVLADDELKKLSFQQLEKYNAQRNAATARGLYCPSGTPSDGRPLDKWTEEELHCKFAELLADEWRERLNAAEIAFGPPLGLFIFGCLIEWIIRGFTPHSKKGRRGEP